MLLLVHGLFIIQDLLLASLGAIKSDLAYLDLSNSVSFDEKRSSFSLLLFISLLIVTVWVITVGVRFLTLMRSHLLTTEINEDRSAIHLKHRLWLT